jgi:flagellar hook assembly protein FlgD
MFNSNVKIVNAAGRLVHEGTSVGGEFTWNGRLSSGKRAASGIYYVLATDEEGNEGATTKFLIVR